MEGLGIIFIYLTTRPRALLMRESFIRIDCSLIRMKWPVKAPFCFMSNLVINASNAPRKQETHGITALIKILALSAVITSDMTTY